MEKKCKERKIINPLSKRCVKVDGRIGKKILKGSGLTIIFQPELYEIWNSYFEDKSIGSSIGDYIWKDLHIDNYVEWYNQFVNNIQNKLKNTDIYVCGFYSYRNKIQLKLIGKPLKHIDADKLKKIVDKKLPKGTVLNDIEQKLKNVISYVFAPDSNDDYFIIYQHKLYSIQKDDHVWRIIKK